MSNIKRHDEGDDVEAFLARVRDLPTPAPGTGNGRLVLAMDATMSRQHSWDMALEIQGDMFAEAGRIGGLDVQLVYFRGFGECRASKWTPDTAVLARLMSGIRCQGGRTQIGRVLKHLKGEAAAGKVNACIYIGDALEEDIDALAELAGEVGLLGIPVFMFQEGRDRAAHARGLFPLRQRCRQDPARTAVGRRRLCRGRLHGVGESLGETRRRGLPPAQADEVTDSVA